MAHHHEHKETWLVDEAVKYEKEVENILREAEEKAREIVKKAEEEAIAIVEKARM